MRKSAFEVLPLVSLHSVALAPLASWGSVSYRLTLYSSVLRHMAVLSGDS